MPRIDSFDGAAGGWPRLCGLWPSIGKRLRECRFEVDPAFAFFGKSGPQRGELLKS